jgi:hypothetical protein
MSKCMVHDKIIDTLNAEEREEFCRANNWRQLWTPPVTPAAGLLASATIYWQLLGNSGNLKRAPLYPLLNFCSASLLSMQLVFLSPLLFCSYYRPSWPWPAFPGIVTLYAHSIVKAVPRCLRYLSSFLTFALPCSSIPRYASIGDCEN